MFAIAKTLGRICGSRCVSLIYMRGVISNLLANGNERTKFITSSSKDGRILRLLKLGENLSKTLVRPFINEIFSSLDLVENVARSRKLSVDIGKEEKNECVGIVDGKGRSDGF